MKNEFKCLLFVLAVMSQIIYAGSNSDDWHLKIEKFAGKKYYQTNCLIGAGVGCIALTMDNCNMYISVLGNPYKNVHIFHDLYINLVDSNNEVHTFNFDDIVTKIPQNIVITDARTVFSPFDEDRKEYKFRVSRKKWGKFQRLLDSRDSLIPEICKECRPYNYKCEAN